MHTFPLNNPSVHCESDVWQLKELIESIKIYICLSFLLALDSFKTLNTENNLLNLTEENIAVIPCELPNGNPKPIPIFTLDNKHLDIESKSSMIEKCPEKKNQIIFFSRRSI
jgi:uncharacterized Zn-finger protein